MRNINTIPEQTRTRCEMTTGVRRAFGPTAFRTFAALIYEH